MTRLLMMSTRSDTMRCRALAVQHAHVH